MLGSEITNNTSATIIEMYDIENGSLRHVTDLPVVRQAPAVAVLNGRLYVIGGKIQNFSVWTPTARVDVIDLVSNQTSTAPSMIKARFPVRAVTFDDKIYAVGRWAIGDFLSFDGMSVEIFDPVTNRWTEIKKFTNEPRFDAAIVALGDVIYAIGGNYDEITCLNSVEKFNPATGEWTYVPDMHSFRCKPCAATDGEKIFVSCDDETVEVYNPVMNRWCTLASMPATRMGAAAVAHDGLLYVIGGFYNDTYFNSIAIYDRLSNNWTISPADLEFGRSSMGVALLGMFVLDMNFCILTNNLN